MSVNLTEKAAKRVTNFIEQQQKGVGLRFGVKRSGCSGWSYVVDLAEHIKESDQIFEDKGVKIVVDKANLALLNGTEIDFVQKGLNQEFAFHNPNVEDECGCGESFTIKAAD